MYTLSGRSCSLNAILAIFAICLIKQLKKGGYSAHGILRPFMTEFVDSLSSSWHGSHTLGKESDSGR